MPAPIKLAPILAGAPNFRDMGGYSTSDSRTVKRRQLYRSVGLAQLTCEYLEIVRSLIAAFEAIVGQYDSIETYLEKAAGLGPRQREALKNLLLE